MALFALARSLGRCGTEQAEKLLLDWASSRAPGSDTALLGLGDLATQRARLREETAVGLLELASGSATVKPWTTALEPLGRMKHLPPSVVERAREVGLSRLSEKGAERIFAIRLLGRTDEGAVPALEGIVLAVGDATPSERAAAVHSLARLGAPGQRSLRAVVAKLVPADKELRDLASLAGADFGPLLSAIEELTDLDGVRAALDRIAKLDVAEDVPPPLLRRVSQLRCSAARLLADRDFVYPLLTHCDRTAPKGTEGEGRFGARASVASIAIEGSQLVGKRRRAWERYANGSDTLARVDALRAIAWHPELDDLEDVLARALESKQGALIAAAAEIVAHHPDRVQDKDEGEEPKARRKRPSPRSGRRDLGKVLVALFDEPSITGDVEVLLNVIDAVGALHADGAREPLGRLCRGPHALVREHAEKALAQLLGGEAKESCQGRDADPPLPPEATRLVEGTTTLVFETDAGELRLILDPSFAPVAVTRVRELVAAGFYDGLVVHRVVPGFVTQVGSPTGDGFGGAPERPALPCETSPIAFSSGSVGMALAGRDTGSSQFFVVHAPTPHLDGQYAWLGESRGAWDALVEGDRIVRARVEERAAP
jgi:cyclophilin family peptidyl-prolyl cis-trans isomerase